MKPIIIFCLLSFISISGFSDKYLDRNAFVSFFSKAPLENIEAKNNDVQAILNTEDGKFAFKVIIKSFLFKKAAMQKHFNQKYLESDKYPNATFMGSIVDFKNIKFTIGVKKSINTKGYLTIHGVKKSVEIPVMLEKIKDGTYQVNSTFPVKIIDYKINIPGKLVNNISEQLKVTVKANLKVIKK